MLMILMPTPRVLLVSESFSLSATTGYWTAAPALLEAPRCSAISGFQPLESRPKLHVDTVGAPQKVVSSCPGPSPATTSPLSFIIAPMPAFLALWRCSFPICSRPRFWWEGLPLLSEVHAEW